jgi:hypothetical protein
LISKEIEDKDRIESSGGRDYHGESPQKRIAEEEMVNRDVIPLREGGYAKGVSGSRRSKRAGVKQMFDPIKLVGLIGNEVL